MLYLVLVFSSLFAGLIQTVTGFGSGIFIMLFLPLCFPILTASALCGAITVVLNCVLTWRFRKYINYKLTVIPALFYIVISTLVVYLAPFFPKELITKILGIFMILLSLYFLFSAGKFEIKPSTLTASVCASLSGCTGGLFGIGGPPMVIYFLAATKEKEEYLGTIQFFFMVTSIENMIARMVRGIFTIDLIPMTLWGIAGIVVGTTIGKRIVDRINGEMMKKLIYVFLGFAGIVNLLF